MVEVNSPQTVLPPCPWPCHSGQQRICLCGDQTQATTFHCVFHYLPLSQEELDPDINALLVSKLNQTISVKFLHLRERKIKILSGSLMRDEGNLMWASFSALRITMK